MSKVIIELKLEFNLPKGLSYKEKVEYAYDLELPEGYVEDSFGIVEFKGESEHPADKGDRLYKWFTFCYIHVCCCNFVGNIYRKYHRKVVSE
jgi:hypothetical protein